MEMEASLTNKLKNFVTIRACSIPIGLVPLVALLLGIIKTLQNASENQSIFKGELKCLQDVKSDTAKCRTKCPGEQFSLFGMDMCHPWLDCDSIQEDVQVTDKIIGGGAVKLVKLGRWKGHVVAVSFLRDHRFTDDFLFNIQMLKMFNTDAGEISDHVVQLIGFCHESQYVVITEYHPFGSAKGAKDILQKDLPLHNSLATRFSLCLNFVQIIAMLHNHSQGKRVLCDANDPEKALSQFLLSADFHLLLNDMDALPVVNELEGILIKCGHKELYGEFIAPEQMWPYEEIPFNDSMMPGYTEKVDVWKIPDIFNYLMDDIAGSNKLKLRLFNIHSKCKSTSDLRPTSLDIFKEYEQSFKLLFDNDYNNNILNKMN